MPLHDKYNNPKSKVLLTNYTDEEAILEKLHNFPSDTPGFFEHGARC